MILASLSLKFKSYSNNRRSDYEHLILTLPKPQREIDQPHEKIVPPHLKIDQPHEKIKASTKMLRRQTLFILVPYRYSDNGPNKKPPRKKAWAASLEAFVFY